MARARQRRVGSQQPDYAEIASLVLFSGYLEQTAAFYRTVGRDLRRGQLRGPRSTMAGAGRLFPGFYVASLDEPAQPLREAVNLAGRSTPV